MEKTPEAWFQNHLPDLQSPDMNTLNSPLTLRQPNTTSPSHMRMGPNVFPISEISPGSSAVPHLKGPQSNQEPHGWFYCLPRFRQTFNPTPNSSWKTEIPGNYLPNHEETTASNGKRFLVFDQSGGQTTVVYSSGLGTPAPCLTSLGPKVDPPYDLNKFQLETGRDRAQYAGLVLAVESDNNRRDDDKGSEMHEDTEEINALLYSSDEDGYSDDDEEEASTDHTPCIVTPVDKQRLFVELGEGVASSFGPVKRMKLMNGGYDVASFCDTASSDKIRKGFTYEDDAESSSGDVEKKRSRKDQIRQTVSILQKILPGGKGKDAIMILDEAIEYLKSLKLKAVELGVELL